VQAYEFKFNPADGLKALTSGMRPVSSGSIAATTSTVPGNVPFDIRITGCHDEEDQEFSNWPLMQSTTSYFVIVAVASEYGSLNPDFVGMVASTT
jgi:hypothetical protein